MGDAVNSKWSLGDLNTLIAAKKYQQDQNLLDTSRERMRTAEMRWKEVESLCQAGHVNRDWKQCKKRWEKLFTDFKKIFDYQKQTPSGHPGYFQLTRAEKKDRSLPPKFIEEIYQSMTEFVPQNRAVDPHPDQYVDSAIEEESRDTQASLAQAIAEESGAFLDETPVESNTTTSTMPPDATPTPVPVDPLAGGIPRQGSGSINETEPGSAERTTRGWKRTRSERTASELQKITQTFVAAISEDRVSRREEHVDQISLEERKHLESLAQQKEAAAAVRETGKEVANALAFIGDSIRYLADGFNRDR